MWRWNPESSDTGDFSYKPQCPPVEQISQLDLFINWFLVLPFRALAGWCGCVRCSFTGEPLKNLKIRMWWCSTANKINMRTRFPYHGDCWGATPSSDDFSKRKWLSPACKTLTIQKYNNQSLRLFCFPEVVLMKTQEWELMVHNRLHSRQPLFKPIPCPYNVSIIEPENNKTYLGYISVQTACLALIWSGKLAVLIVIFTLIEWMFWNHSVGRIKAW